MRLFGRILILAGLACALAPATAGAAPILGSTSLGCGSVLGADTTTCGLVSIDPFGAGNIGGEFSFHNDVALFSFTLAGDTLFSARTTSFATTGFDSTFGVFHADGNLSMVAFPDGSQLARSEDINTDPDNANYDDQLAPFVLSAGSYILALVMYPNDFRQDDPFGLVDSLLAGFQTDDDDPVSCAPSCAFTLDIDASPIEGPSQAVPEPGTLALIGSGALAALVRRRAKKRI
jgi:hypothetical protein